MERRSFLQLAGKLYGKNESSKWFSNIADRQMDVFRGPDFDRCFLCLAKIIRTNRSAASRRSQVLATR
jgi:hypothetical protein